MQIAESNVGKTSKKRTGYLPTLDGWRALAILGVIFTHESLHTFGPFNTRWLYEYGDRGVDTFFAISGILICSRLLEEESQNGSISLRGFYIRRFFRILPAAFLYLFTVVILGLLGYLVVHRTEIFAAIFFYRNYTRLLGRAALPNVAVFTGHFWSLAVEEHFYFILPALLVFTKKRFRVPALLFLTALVLANRAYQLRTRPWLTIRWHTDIRLDALLIPAIIAILVYGVRDKKPLLRAAKWWPLVLLVVISLIPVKPSNWQIAAMSVLLPIMIMGSILHPHNILGKILEHPVLRYIGRVSYSLYLWQQLFVISHFFTTKPLGILQQWPLNLGFSFLCALASFYLVEKPMMRLGHKLAPPATPGREDLSAADTAPSSADGKTPVLT
ncbi:acyltransferase [Granulicella sp. dw_53]|uniref:acyltransferase family protein n=1 Tax=Granulicella sp. dw_53 TaxID=2719792 RepID=UPI001BD6008D|nr:acyltransferase [Granulicella sp. dw_53]